MRDASADIGRRVWAGCPRCADQSGCASCENSRVCESHWRFLLEAEGRRLFVQCPGCWHRWWHDTGFGVGDRSPNVNVLPDFPPPGSLAA